MDFAEIAREVISGFTVKDLEDWLEVAKEKGDSRCLQLVFEYAEKMEAEKKSSDLIVNITPFEIPDASIETIIDRCDYERFESIYKACQKRRKRMQDNDEGPLGRWATLKRIEARNEMEERLKREEEEAALATTAKVKLDEPTDD